MLAVAASLVVASPAAADTYTVTNGLDTSSPAGCANTGSGTWTCNQLRGAIQEANATPAADTIIIAVPTVTLAFASLPINADVNIIAQSAGTGTNAEIDATGAQAPAFQLGGGATATFTALTIRRGTGSNVFVGSGSTANFIFSRITGSLSGPGIDNEGDAELVFSLVDNNAGGGIDNVGGGTQGANLIVGMSTVAANSGFGIRSQSSAANDVSLLHATVARNSGTGLSFDVPQSVSADASIIANNVTNCAGSTVTGVFTVENTDTCGLDAQNQVNTDPQLAASLSFQGGPTDVLTLPADSPAANYVPGQLCVLGQDQRGYTTTPNQPCDAGAYDHEALAAGQQPPTPTPTPPPAQPTPTPVPPAEPTPVPNRSVVGEEERGTVKVKLPGSSQFVDLNDVTSLPNNTEIDTRKGAITLKAVTKPGGPVEEATFYDGLFKLNQRGGVTTLALSEVLDCAKAKRGKGASAAAKKAKKRKLWGDGKGSFRTQGKYSAATVRGTKWLTEDTCTTTTVRVTQGVVSVEDLVKKKKVTVRAGKRYVARAKK